jgi:hypothetical protein
MNLNQFIKELLSYHNVSIEFISRNQLHGKIAIFVAKGYSNASPIFNSIQADSTQANKLTKLGDSFPMNERQDPELDCYLSVNITPANEMQKIRDRQVEIMRNVENL